VCTHIFAMTPDGKSALFEGKLDDFEHLAEISGFPNILRLENQPTPSSLPAAKSSIGNNADHAKNKNVAAQEVDKKELKKLAKEKEVLELEMAEIQGQLNLIEIRMQQSVSGKDVKNMGLMQKEYKALKDKLFEKENQWLALAERMDPRLRSDDRR
jgi:ATP-binding cassette subfamily F protein 3